MLDFFPAHARFTLFSLISDVLLLLNLKLQTRNSSSPTALDCGLVSRNTFPMNVLIISCSLGSNSRSRLLGQLAAKSLSAIGADADLLDLCDHDLPLCSGSNHIDPSIGKAIEQAGAILISSPVYNYDLNAAAKNLMEHTGKAWTGKAVGFLCAAGGTSSYMAPLGFANSLMLDFHCYIIPRFVYAPSAAFDENRNPTDEIKQRIEQLCQDAVQLAKAIT